MHISYWRDESTVKLWIKRRSKRVVCPDPSTTTEEGEHHAQQIRVHRTGRGPNLHPRWDACFRQYAVKRRP